MTSRILTSYRFGRLFGWWRRLTSSRRKQIKAVRRLYQQYGLVESGCKLCKGQRFTLLAESDRYGFDLRKQFCDDCGLVQTYPTVSNAFLDEFYAHLYRPLYTKATGPVDYPSLVNEQREKGQRLLTYLRDSLDQDLAAFSLIEMGCSSGGILAEVAPYFQSVQGCDLDVAGTAYARETLGLNVETREMPSHLPQGPIIFLMSHVLEHVNDPLGKMRAIRALMKPSDFFVVIVPGINAVKAGDYKHDLRRYFHIAHLTDFSAGTLGSMASQASLSCVAIDESVRAIFCAGELPTHEPIRQPQDSLENILSIERTY